MALTSFQVSVINKRLRGVSDQIIKKSLLIQELAKRKRIIYGQGGDGIRKDVRYRVTAKTQAIGDFTEPQAVTTDDFMALVVQWSKYGKALAQSKFQLKRNANADDRDRQFKLMIEEIASFKQEMVSRIGTDLYLDGTLLPGDTATPIIGLGASISASNTYLGLDRAQAVNAWWRAQVGIENDFNGDALLSDVPNGIVSMNKVTDACKVGKQKGDGTGEDLATEREELDFTICSLNAYHAYEIAVEGRRRFTVKDEIDGRDKLGYDKHPIDWDTFAPSTPNTGGNNGVGTMLFLNFEHIKLESVEENGQLFNTYAEDDTGMIKKQVIAGQMQLTCWKPAAEGRLTINNLPE